MSDIFRASRAITRAIPDSFADALVQVRPPEPIRVDVARRQHRAYVAALESLGLTVSVLPALHGFPDSCFVEDCAVCAEGVALIARPGVPSRQGEVEFIAEALRRHVRIERMPMGATLDGGDCLRVGNRFYVGSSTRTNAAGVGRLREVFAPLGFDVVEVPVGKLLHLKSACSYLGGGWLLLAPGTVLPEVFRDVRIIPVPADEAHAANSLAVNGAVLTAGGCSGTQRAVAAAGFRIIELETSEFRKADGALTCLSLLL